MSKKINELLNFESVKIFNSELVAFMSFEEADNLIKNTNWNFIDSVVDEFSYIVENHGIDDAVDIYRSAYDDELGFNEAEKISTEFSLVLLGMSMQNYNTENVH